MASSGLDTSDIAGEYQALVLDTLNETASHFSPPATPEPTTDDSSHFLDWNFDPEPEQGETLDGKHDAIDVLTRPIKLPTTKLPEITQASASTEVLDLLSSIWKDKKSREDLCDLKGDDAQLIIDYLYFVLLRLQLPESWHRRHFIIALYKLCKASRKYPPCYTLNQLNGISRSLQPSEGRYSDIYEGKFGEKKLCLKLVRLYGERNLETMLKIYAKEAILWGQLNHPNIAIFYGIYYLDSARERLCLVSPWMQNGNLKMYLLNNPFVDREPFVYDVVSGLGYLHERRLVHSDLKGTNILVNDAKQACITDFGVSFIWTDQTLTEMIGTSTGRGYDPRWAAPELLENGRPTMETDMWAFGCVCLEILTGAEPHQELKNYKNIKQRLKKRQPPKRLTPKSLFNPIWSEVDSCWSQDPEKRPQCRDVLGRLGEAKISRRDNIGAQYDIERQRQQFRAEMGIAPEQLPDPKMVKRILLGVAPVANVKFSNAPLPAAELLTVVCGASDTPSSQQPESLPLPAVNNSIPSQPAQALTLTPRRITRNGEMTTETPEDSSITKKRPKRKAVDLHGPTAKRSK